MSVEKIKTHEVANVFSKSAHGVWPAMIAPPPFFRGRIVDLSRATVDVCRVIPSDRVLAMALNGSYSQFVTCSIFLFNLYS